MSTLYVDTSALLKQYVDELGSKWTRELLKSTQGLIATASLTRVEVACAFARRMREGLLSPLAYDELWQAFSFDTATRFRTVAIQEPALRLAEQLARHHPLRAYDTIHLAVSLLLNSRLRTRGKPALVFISADTRLLEIALKEGLAIDNPLAH